MKNSNAFSLVANNVNLVYSLAHELQKQRQYPNYDDLVNAGMEGLVMAAEKFDAEKGKFSSFAAIYILGYMRKDLDKFTRTLILDMDSEADYEDDSCEAWKIVDEMLEEAQLDNRQQHVICAKYGIGCEERSTNDLADEYGLSVQMINVIKRQAFEKMRAAA